MVRACLQPRLTSHSCPTVRANLKRRVYHTEPIFPPPPSRPKTKKQNKKTLIRKLEQPVHCDQSRDRFPACSWMFSLSPLLSLTQVHLRVSPSTVTGSGLVEAVAACRQHEQQATQDTRCPGPRAKQPHFTPTPPSPVYPSLKRTKSFIK